MKGVTITKLHWPFASKVNSNKMTELHAIKCLNPAPVSEMTHQKALLLVKI